MGIYLVIKHIIALFVALILTYHLVPIMIQLARRLDVLDVPDGIIKRQLKAVPYLGGIALFGGFVTALAFVAPGNSRLFHVLAGSTVLLLLGLLDDLIVLRWNQKLLGQIIAAICFLRAGLYLKASFFSSYLNLILSSFWIVLISNAFNLIDVMDGLAATTAIGVSCAFCIAGLLTARFDVSIAMAAFIGSLSGYLIYNRPPARIYLGDAGALFIGGVLATMPFLIDWGAYGSWGYLAPVIMLAIPLLEVTTLIIVRCCKKIPFYHASPDHFCMYLKRCRQWGTETILLFVVAMSSVLIVSSLLLFLSVISLAQASVAAAIYLTIWYGCMFWQRPVFARI